jgi:Holliday junction DNA helicase RuvA
MIAHLRGKLIHKEPGQAIVECAGVGYDVVISVPTFTALPSVSAWALPLSCPGLRLAWPLR